MKRENMIRREKHKDRKKIMIKILGKGDKKGKKKKTNKSKKEKKMKSYKNNNKG